MTTMRPFAFLLLSLIVVTAAAEAQAPKRGGVLNSVVTEDPPGFSIHESATVSTVWPMSPCYNNLVYYDPMKSRETVDTIVGELAEKWSWQDNHRNLVFFLRKNVKWHDGQPFTSRDVKYTFDVVRESADAPAKLRLSPRKDWYANIEAIETPDAHTVVFRMRRPQPSLLLMLASGYSPVYPAHVPLADLRQKCVGTGPFKLKEYVRGQTIELVRNPDYFVPNRPYLDGIKYTIIGERGTRLAALQTGRLDAFVPLDMTKVTAETAKKAAPTLVVQETGQNGSDNIIVNHKKAPFDNVAVRRAVNYALNRAASISSVRHGGAVPGAAMMPPPFGTWGLPSSELRNLPGYREPARDRAEAKKLLASAGYGPGKTMRLEMATRTLPVYVDLASYVVDQLKQVGIEVQVKQIDTAQWFPGLARKEFVIAANLTAPGADDPDVMFYENFKCGTARNYSDYCDEQTDRMIDQQSSELDKAKR
jgi:peptide/nickel transport system substrate-binding protein